MLQLSRIIFAGILLVAAVADVKARMVSMWILAAGSILALTACVYDGLNLLPLHLEGLLAGGVFLLVSKCTRQALGYGDSLLIMVLGLYLGLWNLLILLSGSWILAGFAAGYLLIRKNFKRSGTIPMMPFLLLGYVMMWAGEIFIG